MSRELPKPGAKYARYVPSSSLPSPAPPSEARSLPSSLNSQAHIPCLRSTSRTPGHCYYPRAREWGDAANEQRPQGRGEWCGGGGSVQPRSLDELCLMRQAAARHAVQRPAENIYQDTPPLHKPSPSKGKCQNNNSVIKRRTSLKAECAAGGDSAVVTSQPKKAAAAAGPHWLPPAPPPPYSPSSSPASGPALHHSGDDSVICQSCGKCRCQACRQAPPHQCPSCSGSDTAVECVTCMWCVRATLYHCARGDAEDAAQVAPWSCRPDADRCCRWAVLCGAALLLPCVCCYPVARGCRRAVASREWCGRRGPGCRCRAPSLEVQRCTTATSPGVLAGGGLQPRKLPL